MTKRWRVKFSAGMQGAVAAAGSPAALVGAVVLVLVWIVVGGLWRYNNLWFALLHAGTGVSAFVMVFLIRHAEGREASAMLVKLDELVAATSGASDRVIGVEQESLDRQEEIEEGAPHGGVAGREASLAEPEAARREASYDDDLPLLDDLAAVTALVQEHDELFVRYSEGPAHDSERGGSRDDEAGIDLPGLVVTTIIPEDWWSGSLEDWVARRICKYQDLGEAEGRYPWLLTGSQVGWGPDHEPLVKLGEAVGRIGPEALREAKQRYHESFDVGNDSRPG
ncbi:DUF6098 family protein [Nocardioides antri]|uniref:Low affinity iron permease family protein n=1 Tax=Nocardioides antri TaxID=2607659 RepID=A0A5B1LXI8_9ACTN|nr:DUF6098 family protein [Nocardioides antri]KAA1424297.1 low affinity iron permease family protein [Nocardioides antri]